MIFTKPRPPLAGVSPYLPGKPIAEVQRELGLKSVIKLASNENPLGPSPRALAAAQKALEKIHLYPEGATPLLRHALGAELRVGHERVIIGNGSDEIIRLVCLAFLAPGDHVVVSQYGFIRFKQQSMMMGARVEEVPMRGWRNNLDAMAEACTSRTKVVFVASPNNPTGTWNTEREFEAFLDRVPRSTLVVLDEAYWHYVADRPLYHERAAFEWIRLHSNLVILRTFSKAYGLAGLRVGYGVGDPDLVRWLDRIRMPFNVNLPAQAAALAALGDPEFVADSVRLVDQQRPLLRHSLQSLGLDCPDTGTNFLFADTRRDARHIFNLLLRQGVIVRPLAEYGLPTHLRVTVGTAAQNRRLVAAMRHALGGGNGHA